MLKKILWPLVALLSLVAFLFNRSTPWKGRAEKAQQEATEAKTQAAETKAESAKERIDSETQQKLDDLADTSDAGLIASVIKEHRRRNNSGADVEGP